MSIRVFSTIAVALATIILSLHTLLPHFHDWNESTTMPVAVSQAHGNDRLIDLLRHMINLDQGEGHLMTTVEEQLTVDQDKDCTDVLLVSVIIAYAHYYPTPSFRGSSFIPDTQLPAILREVRVVRGPPVA